jgi:beta-phosphoglucomutase-like phosphatase (HAD superfamily)
MIGLIFDVEGTLVDCVAQTLESWRETLAESGFAFSIAELHAFSGMDTQDMLRRLLPADVPAETRRQIAEAQGARYRKKFLPSVAAFPSASLIFEDARAKGRKIALATSCQPDELKHYLSLLGIHNSLAAIACGSDVRRGKPHPDLYRLALDQLNVPKHKAIAIGDTPFDARAAAGAGIAAIGILTGGFSARELAAAGCIATVKDHDELRQRLDEILSVDVAE